MKCPHKITSPRKQTNKGEKIEKKSDTIFDVNRIWTHNTYMMTLKVTEGVSDFCFSLLLLYLYWMFVSRGIFRLLCRKDTDGQANTCYTRFKSWIPKNIWLRDEKMFLVTLFLCSRLFWDTTFQKVILNLFV